METIEELKLICETYCALRNDIDILKEELNGKQNRVKELEVKIIHILDAHEMDKFSASGIGTISRHSRFSVKVPKTQEDREAFFSYLKGHGVFETMITVNSNTLNAWYKEEIEKASIEGKDDVNIPGLKDISTYDVLSWRK